MIAAKKFSAKITKKQCMEFGQVATLVVLIFALHYKNDHWVAAAFVLILITIILPVIFFYLYLLLILKFSFQILFITSIFLKL